MENRKTLDQLGIQAGTDKSSSYHNYLSLYGTYFETIRDKENKILEIGILKGQSLRIFSEYFQNSHIFAVDIEDKKEFQSDRISIYQEDQSDVNFLNSFETEFFDIILDDGSHKLDHQQISFGHLFSKLKPGGIYILEDLHTSLLDYPETLVHGHGLFNILPDGTNSTIDFLRGFYFETGPNHYLPHELYEEVKSSISTVKIVETSRRGSNDVSITSVIYKK
jgi:hypothetical protein